MTIDEQSRHQLFERLDAVLGRDEAATLMSYLPPVGWADVATKHDIAGLRHEFDRRFEVVDHQFAALDHRFEAIDHQFAALDHRFEALDPRFDALDPRFDALDHRFEAMEHRILGAVHKTSRDHLQAMVWANIGQLVAVGSLLLAAVRL
ncbi:MAG: hypothetical protein ACRDZN_11820 [Acidimicrobiales bacterium]